MNDTTLIERLVLLRRPFHPDEIEFKPGVVRGNRGLALSYVGLRAYQERLDEVFGTDWEITYAPWGDDKIIATLTLSDETVMSVSRSAVGEGAAQGDNGGTSAEAQAFKRACAQFGLGRYLYSLPQVWAEYDEQKKMFAPSAVAMLKSRVIAHYNQATGSSLPAPATGHTQVEEEPGPGSFAAGDDDEDSLPVIDTLLSWVRATQAEGGKEASEAQMKKLANVLTWVCGKASNGYACIELLLGSRATPTSAVASALIERLDKTTWDAATKTASPNPKYNEAAANAVKDYYDAHRA